MKKYFLACGYVWLLLSSCYTPRYVYSPAAHNVPLLTKKGDSRLAFNYSSNLAFIQKSSKANNSYGFDLQGAFAIGKHFALQSGYYSRQEKNEGNFSTNLDSSVIRYKRNLFEFGVGYYRLLDSASHFTFQVFSGAGIGKFSFTDNGKNQGGVFYNRFHEADITKVYLQPALVFLPGPQISLSVSSRFSLINFHNINTDYTDSELRNYELDSLGHSDVIFWEPSFINSFGFKKIPGLRMEYQLGMSLLMSRKFVDGRSFNFSAGLVLDLQKMLKREQ
ncbi:MAG TPA: hypothetical protein VK498_06970 [Ferruginibacter sp.]|nr:hypothetical protein [Ferruginibacter sp.]